MSQRSRRHSKELTANSKVAGGIVRSTDNKQCVHFEGEAKEVPTDDLEKIHEMYGARYGANKPERLEEAKSGKPNARTYYVFKPKLIVLFDEANFPEGPRQEFKL